MQVLDALPEVHLLLQTHDSATFQFKKVQRDYYMAEIRKNMAVQIPYDDPLVIPVEGKDGPNWGSC